MVDQAAQLAELVGGDWSARGELGHRPCRDRGLPLLLGGQPRRVPRRRPGDRGGRRGAARHPRPRPQRRHRGAGPGDRRGVAVRRRARPAPPPTRRPAPTRWRWRGRWSRCSPACRRTATASSSGASAPRHLIDTQARMLHWAVTGRRRPRRPRPRRASRPGRAPGRCSVAPPRAAQRSVLTAGGSAGALPERHRAAAVTRGPAVSGSGVASSRNV